jgi:hypothetical protein
MAQDETGTANGLARMLCALCGCETLHSHNRCVQCHTIVVFPSEQRKVHLSANQRKGLLALDDTAAPRHRRPAKLKLATP